MKATSLELAVLQWVATRSTDPALRKQIEFVCPVTREYSGARSFTEFSLPADSPQVERARLPHDGKGPMEGPEVTGPEFEYAACSLLWFTEGRLTMPEIAGPRAVGEVHPEIFTLSPS